MPPGEPETAEEREKREEEALKLLRRLSRKNGVERTVPETELALRDLVYLVVMVGGMLLSYGKLAEKVNGLDARIERVERQMDSTPRGPR